MGEATTSTGSASPSGGPLGPVEAANALIALPWGNGLSQEFQKRTNETLAQLNGSKFVDAHGSWGQIGASWGFSLGADNLAAVLHISSPPGFTVAASNQFGVSAPLNGSWSFDLSGTITANAHWPGGSAPTQSVPFAVTISEVSLLAGATLDVSDPTRPTLLNASLGANAVIGGNVLFPSIPVGLPCHRAPDGILTGRASITQQLTLPGLGLPVVTSNAYVMIQFFPYSLPPLSYQGGPQIITFNDTLLAALVSVGASLSVTFPDPVGKQDIGVFSWGLPLLIPVPTDLAHSIALLQGQVPLQWPPTGTPPNPKGLVPPPPASIDFATPRDTLEQGILTHMPYGAVLTINHPPDFPPSTIPFHPPLTGVDSAVPSIDIPPGSPRPSPTPIPTFESFTYAIDADSTLWTGLYLAAEAFRYAATQSPDALARIQLLLGGLKHDFDVTADAVIMDHVITPVDPKYTGVFARSALPDNDLHGWTDTVAERTSRGACLYMQPKGGWNVLNPSGQSIGNYPTYAAAQAAIPLPGVFRPDPYTITPVDTAGQPIWYGSGCGDNLHGDRDSPLSRDQYSGVMMGLAFAYKFLPDGDLRKHARDMFETALDYVLDNSWNVPLPPHGRITTFFMGGLDAQLALLRIGAHIDPPKYGGRYDYFAAASALVWIPVWLSTIDPVSTYFKFNLGHAFPTGCATR